jgi:hypothetical protein
MRNIIRKKLVAPAVIILSVISCNTGTFDLGQEFVRSATYTELFDTVSISVSTYRLDSVKTSGSGTALVGEVEIPQVGTMRAQSFFKVTMSSSATWSNKESYDSVCISLKHGSTYIGDTLKPFTLVVNRLTQALSANDEGYIYNNRTTAYEETPIGTYTYLPRPGDKPNISFRLNDDFGQEIMNFCKENYQNSDRDAFFEKFLRGIRLGSGSGTESLMSYAANDSNMVISLYSHLPAIESEVVTREITLSSSTIQYNNTKLDNIGHNFDNLNGSKDKLPSKNSDDMALMHECSGYYARIDFPYIDELQDANQKGYVIKADLLLYPVKGSYEKGKLPSYIYLHEIKKINDLGSALTNSSSSQVTGTLYSDPLYDDNVYYKADITQYINSRLTETIVNTDNGITFTLSSAQSSTNLTNILIDCTTNKSNRSSLKLYYYYYDKD